LFRLTPRRNPEVERMALTPCILVVDDDEGQRKSLTLLLKRKSFETEQAGSGKEALAIAQGRHIDVTLLDIRLPDIDGIRLLAPLKKTNPDMVIIMITGFASVESAVQALTEGASSYITKPINLEELFLKIKNILDHQHLVNEVRKAEKKIESLAKFPEENPNPVLRVSSDGVLIYANKSADFILSELRLSVGTKMPEFFEKILKNAIECGSRLELEKTVHEKTYLFTIAPIFGQNYVNLYGLDITDRKKAEQKLIKNESKFRELFDHMSSGVAIYEADAEGNDFFIKNLNHAGERIDNLTRQDVIGKNILGIFPAVKEFGLFDVLQRVLRTGVAESHPATLYKDARITGWRENFVYKLPSGEIAAIYDDITERKQAEDALRDSEEKFRGIFDTINDGIHIHEIEPDGTPGKFIEVNEVACRMLQYTREELLRLGPLDIVSGYHSRPFDEIIGELSSSGQAIFETGHHRKDGSIVPVEINAHVVNLQGKRMTVSAIRDNTERKHAEVALKESETYLKTIFNSTQIGLLIIDPVTHSIYDVNPAALELLGRTRDKLIGTICHESVCPAERGKCPITDLGQKIDNSERILLRANGERIPILKTIVPIVIQDHSYLLESFVDITDRKLMESEIRSLNIVLEQRVKERTEALSKTNDALEEENAQRLEAEGKLQASHDEKVLLLKEIHHRVKNNLQIIVSLLRLQKRQIADTATRQQILDSESRIRSMALVHEKLYRSTDFASIDFEDYLKTLVNQLVTLYATNPGQIRIVIDMKGISVDINQSIPLGLIMNELISNAMKHAFPEGRTGELSISGMRQGGSNVFTVRDNGIGIPDDFDWHKTKSLGMHLVIMLTDQLNGTIELEKGEGALFRITLPEKT
jgi:PAS domain S-box-containing protein